MRASIQWSESVRLKFSASSDSFLDLVEKVLAIPGLDFGSAAKLEKGVRALGLTFQNAPLEKNKCMAIMALKPFVKVAGASLQALEEAASGTCHNFTNLMRIAQTVKKDSGAIGWRGRPS